MVRTAITSRYKQKMVVLPIQVYVTKPDFVIDAQKKFRNRKINFNTLNKYTAIWDTGATNTSINKKLVGELGLVSTGFKNVDTGNGRVNQTPTYIIDIIREADFLVACHEYLVGKFENPRFSS